MGGAGEAPPEDGGPPPPAALRRGPHARRLAVEAAGIYLDYSKNRITDETLRLLLQLAREVGLQDRIDAMFRATRSTSRRTARCFTSPCARRAGLPSLTTARTWCPRSMPFWTRWRFRSSATQRRLEGPYGQAHPQCDQYRHRRIGSRTGHGVRSAEALQRAGHDLPLRLQRRWYGFRRGGARSRSRGDVVHHLLEDLHHAGDHDERAQRA